MNIKKRNIIIWIYVYIISLTYWIASNIPRPNDVWLPWWGWTVSLDNDNIVLNTIGNLIATTIGYIAVIAVLAVMYGGILYLLSSWEEEKTKKAKNVIIWALAWVFISVTAWTMITILNNFRL